MRCHMKTGHQREKPGKALTGFCNVDFVYIRTARLHHGAPMLAFQVPFLLQRFPRNRPTEGRKAGSVEGNGSD